MLNEMDVPPPLPPPPPSLERAYSQEQKDSIDLSYLRLRERLISESFKKRFYKKEKRIVAISKNLGQLNSNYTLDDTFSNYSDLFMKLKSIKEPKDIDISNIYTNRYDSIIYFSKKLLTKGSREFYDFDFLVSFSRVIFNKKYNRAIVKGSVSTSKLSGASVLYFLKKTANGRWIIEYEKGLSIS